MSIKLSKIASFFNHNVIGEDTSINNIIIDSREINQETYL